MKVKSVIAAILLAVSAVTLLPASVKAESEQIISIQTGDPSRELPSKSDIVKKEKAITKANTVYEVEPSVQAPYTTGKLSDAFLQNGVDYLNYIRYIAHLPNVQLDDKLNEEAQHGAVVLAAGKQFTHYPVKPADMDEDFFNAGYAATTSSNLGYGYWTMQSHLLGGMEDDSSDGNLTTVGHRRWLLSSKLLNVGFGFAQNGYPYSVTKVFDRSGPRIDYDAISWPASGNMPTELFYYTVPWSITFHSSKYTLGDTPVEIRVINETTGEVWVFDENTASAPNGKNAYFLMENSYYGDGPITFIFRPDISKSFIYSGKYTVEVRGMVKKSQPDQPIVLTYQVDFFSTEDYDLTEGAGNVDGIGGVNNLDVEYLLWYTLFPGDYPLINSGDVNRDGVINNLDVEYLLWYTLFPDDYPLV